MAIINTNTNVPDTKNQQSETNQIKTAISINQPPNRLILILLTILICIMVIVFGLSIFIRKQAQPMVDKPLSSTMVKAPSSMPDRPISNYAKSDKFQNFLKNLNQIKQITETTDLTESQLAFPLLDMQVSF